MKINSKKGFTLIEIIFALAVLLIGVVGVLALFPVGLKASKKGGDFTLATLAAQQVMEAMRRAGSSAYSTTGAPYWRPAGFTGPTGGYTYSEGIDNGNGVDLPDGFSWAARVTDPGVSNLSQVTLSIYWLDRGSYRWRNFATYLAKYN